MKKIREDGLIFTVALTVLEWLKWLNIVEYFKAIARKLFSGVKSHAASLWAIDIFVILKWSFLLLVSILGGTSNFLVVCVCYLIFSNSFTYLHHHVLRVHDPEKEKPVNYDTQVKRRFIMLWQAILFNICCFAYFYGLPYASEYSWGTRHPTALSFIYLSVANSLTIDYLDVKAISPLGANVLLWEVVTSFFFFTIILSNSIPSTLKSK